MRETLNVTTNALTRRLKRFLEIKENFHNTKTKYKFTNKNFSCITVFHDFYQDAHIW